MALILQWNLNGLYAHLEELKLIMFDKNPKIMCLQETHLKNNHEFTIQGYTNYYRNRTDERKTSGGVAICVKEASHQKIGDCGKNQSSAEHYHVTSFYIPRDKQITVEELHQLIETIPGPRIVLGDRRNTYTIPQRTTDFDICQECILKSKSF